MQYDLTNLQKKNERRLPAVAKSFLYESKRNSWSYTMKFQIRHSWIRANLWIRPEAIAGIFFEGEGENNPSKCLWYVKE